MACTALTNEQMAYLYLNYNGRYESNYFAVIFDKSTFVFDNDGISDFIDQNQCCFAGVFKNQEAYSILMQVIQLSRISHIKTKNIGNVNLYLN